MNVKKSIKNSLVFYQFEVKTLMYLSKISHTKKRNLLGKVFLSLFVNFSYAQSPQHSTKKKNEIINCKKIKKKGDRREESAKYPGRN